MVCFFFKFESKTGFEGVRLGSGCFFTNFYVHDCDFRFCFPVWFCSVVGVVLFFCLMSLCSVWFQFVCVLVFFAVFFSLVLCLLTFILCMAVILQFFFG